MHNYGRMGGVHIYGQTLLSTPIATKEDLDKIVICASKLPDISEVIDGAVMYLTDHQKGYVATHFYKAKDGKWVDLSVDYDASAVIAEDPSAFVRYQAEKDPTDGKTYLTGYLNIGWKPVKDLSDDTLKYTAIVRKWGNDYPKVLDDGQVLARASSMVQRAAGSLFVYEYFDEDACTQWNGSTDNCKYTLFHVYASGSTSRTDIA